MRVRVGSSERLLRDAALAYHSSTPSCLSSRCKYSGQHADTRERCSWSDLVII